MSSNLVCNLLVKTNRTPTARSSDFVISRMTADGIRFRPPSPVTITRWKESPLELFSVFRIV